MMDEKDQATILVQSPQCKCGVVIWNQPERILCPECYITNLLSHLDEANAKISLLRDSVHKLLVSDDALADIREQIETLKAERDNEVANTTANLLCYLVDNYENQSLGEEKFLEIGIKFLCSDYAKKKENKNGQDCNK